MFVIVVIISSWVNCISIARSRARNVTGCSDYVKLRKTDHFLALYLDRIRLNHQTVIIQQIMKPTRHQYHYVVRCCKRKKLGDNISNSKQFWK